MLLERRARSVLHASLKPKREVWRFAPHRMHRRYAPSSVRVKSASVGKRCVKARLNVGRRDVEAEEHFCSSRTCRIGNDVSLCTGCDNEPSACTGCLSQGVWASDDDDCRPQMAHGTFGGAHADVADIRCVCAATSGCAPTDRPADEIDVSVARGCARLHRQLGGSNVALYAAAY